MYLVLSTVIPASVRISACISSFSVDGARGRFVVSVGSGGVLPACRLCAGEERVIGGKKGLIAEAIGLCGTASLFMAVLKVGIFTTNERDKLLAIRSADIFARH
jgi:hypothetical protein